MANINRGWTGSGFEAWRNRQAAKANDMGRDDAAYEAYLDAATGRLPQRTAGVTTSGEPGGADLSEANDDVIYSRYRAELDGTAARRRAEENARREYQDRIAEHRRHSREQGFPLQEQYR